jgi:hypothetical protein
MTVCPSCDEEGAYILFNLTHCKNNKCKNHVASYNQYVKARVHWEVNGFKGTSPWLPIHDAKERARKGLREHGKGTHWVEVYGRSEFLWM